MLVVCLIVRIMSFSPLFSKLVSMPELMFRLGNRVSTSKNEDLSQDSINKQILAQLSTLGDRYATLEHNTAVKCKQIFGC